MNDSCIDGPLSYAIYIPANLHTSVSEKSPFISLFGAAYRTIGSRFILRKQRRRAANEGILLFNRDSFSFHTRQVVGSGPCRGGMIIFLYRPRCHGVGSKKQDGDITREPAPVTGVVGQTCHGVHKHTCACIRIGPTKAYTRSLRLIIITGGAEADFRSTYSSICGERLSGAKTTYGYFRNGGDFDAFRDIYSADFCERKIERLNQHVLNPQFLIFGWLGAKLTILLFKQDDRTCELFSTPATLDHSIDRSGYLSLFCAIICRSCINN